MSKLRVAPAPPEKQAAMPGSNGEVLADLVRSLESLSRRVPKGALREKADEAWRAAKILELGREEGVELAGLDEIQVTRRDGSPPKSWDGAAILAAAQLTEGIDCVDHADRLQSNLDFLLSPDEIAHELRGLAQVCHAIGTSDTVDAGEACWAVEQALRRLAARAERLKRPGPAGAEHYAVMGKPKKEAAA